MTGLAIEMLSRGLETKLMFKNTKEAMEYAHKHKMPIVVPVPVLVSADIGNDELLSCPFCGGRPKVQDNGDYEIVMCLNGNCYAQVSIRDRETKSAREVWNTRVLD